LIEERKEPVVVETDQGRSDPEYRDNQSTVKPVTIGHSGKSEANHQGPTKKHGHQHFCGDSIGGGSMGAKRVPFKKAEEPDGEQGEGVENAQNHSAQYHTGYFGMQGLIRWKVVIMLWFMRGEKKKRALWIKVLGGGLAGVVVLGIGVNIMINRYLSEAFLEEQIEAAINSEAEVGSLKISILSSPARLTLKDVKLSPKPADAGGGDSLVSVDEVVLKVSLWSLLEKKIEVNEMTIQGAHVTGTIYKEGGSSLARLFESPQKAKKRLEQEKSKKGKGKKTKHLADHKSKKSKPSVGEVADTKTSKDVPEEAASGGLNAFDQADFVASLGGFYLKDSSVDLTIEKSGLRIRANDVNISLGSLSIDPQRLQDTDTATVKTSMHLQLDSTEGWQYADLFLKGGAEARIFNPKSGNMEPDVEADLNLGDESSINTRIPAMTKAWKELEKLRKIGIKVGPLAEKATFGRSQSMAVHYHKGLVTVTKPLSLWLADWEVAILAKSWVLTKTDQHEIHSEVLASKKLSASFHDVIFKGVDYLPRDIKKSLVKKMENKLFRDGRFFVKIKSSGDLSHPKIRLVDGVPDIKKSAEKAGKDLLQKKAGHLLNGLFGK